MFAPLRDEGRLGRNFATDNNSNQRNLDVLLLIFYNLQYPSDFNY